MLAYKRKGAIDIIFFFLGEKGIWTEWLLLFFMLQHESQWCYECYKRSRCRAGPHGKLFRVSPVQAELPFFFFKYTDQNFYSNSKSLCDRLANVLSGIMSKISPALTPNTDTIWNFIRFIDLVLVSPHVKPIFALERSSCHLFVQSRVTANSASHHHD